MMRPTHIAAALALCITAAVSVQASPQAPSVTPAKKSSTAAAPEQNNGQKAPRVIVTEIRERGQVTEATVTRGNNTYHLKPNIPPGSAQQGDAQSTGNRAAQWQIFQFDLQREARQARPASPPPAAPHN